MNRKYYYFTFSIVITLLFVGQLVISTIAANDYYDVDDQNELTYTINIQYNETSSFDNQTVNVTFKFISHVDYDDAVDFSISCSNDSSFYGLYWGQCSPYHSIYKDVSYYSHFNEDYTYAAGLSNIFDYVVINKDVTKTYTWDRRVFSTNITKPFSLEYDERGFLDVTNVWFNDTNDQLAKVMIDLT